MKTPLWFVLGLLAMSPQGSFAAEKSGIIFTDEVPAEVAITLGPRRFRKSDAIVIEKVLATSRNLTVGDTVIVKGRYDLKSEESARLSLLLTSSEPPGKGTLSATQSMKVERGAGKFELTCEVKSPGALHVTLYNVSGKPFGGMYFGTRAQMVRIREMTLSDYEK